MLDGGVDGPIYDPPLEDQGVVSDEGEVLS